MKDICVVGFGLAGLSVAKHAEKIGLTFDIIANNSQLSSKIAGGLLNPVSVKRMKPVWQVEKYFEYALSFYKQLSLDLKADLIQSIPISVFIHLKEQENNWYEAYDNNRLKPFISPQVFRNDFNDVLNIKVIGQIEASLVNLTDTFSFSKKHYQNLSNFKEKTFDHKLLVIKDNSIAYDNISYKHIIFCEGYGITNNPYFNDLGIYGNKGDYIIFKSKKLQLNSIAKAKYFLIPLGEDVYKFGATYQRQPLNHIPSEDAFKQMKAALDKMINVPYKIIDQVCGIRPTTKDRRPILGTHRKYQRLHILNGFGSRGVMLSPKLGKDLLNHIFKKEPIEYEVSIHRIYAQT